MGTARAFPFRRISIRGPMGVTRSEPPFRGHGDSNNSCRANDYVGTPQSYDSAGDHRRRHRAPLLRTRSLTNPAAKEKLASGSKNTEGLLGTGSIASKSANALAKSSPGTTTRVGTNSCLQPQVPRAGLRWAGRTACQLEPRLRPGPASTEAQVVCMMNELGVQLISECTR